MVETETEKLQGLLIFRHWCNMSALFSCLCFIAMRELKIDFIESASRDDQLRIETFESCLHCECKRGMMGKLRTKPINNLAQQYLLLAVTTIIVLFGNRLDG